MDKQQHLTYENHSRYFADCRYIYPVVSRRSQGLSLGINLNLNNACNWRCVYCQVEGLVRGNPDPVDRDVLVAELDFMLNWIVNGDFIQQFAPIGLQRFNDICLAGNGEPTLSPDFNFVCDVIAKLRAKYNLQEVKTVLITNGSQIHNPQVQEGLKTLALLNGEIWFKVDRVSKTDILAVNQVALGSEGISKRLKIAAGLITTYIQSCWFSNNGNNPSQSELDDFIQFISGHQEFIAGVLLYSTARQPALAEGGNITQVSHEFLQQLNQRILDLGIYSRYHV